MAEYRPDSRSIVYRVDPETMKATEMLRVRRSHRRDRPQHRRPHAARRELGLAPLLSLDARRRRTRHQRRRAAGEAAHAQPVAYVDYQDCKYVGGRRMLCTGVTEIRQTPDAPPFRLGGIELVNLADGRPLHQVPMLLWTRAGST